MPRIAVTIPSFSGHIPILGETLQSIAQQTQPPALVIVYASSIQADSPAVKQIEELLAASTRWPFHLQIHTTSEKQYVGANRNAANSLVPEDIDVISHFDSDDLMHPRRLEFIAKAFEDPEISAVVHNYEYWNAERYPEYPDLVWEPPTKDSSLKIQKILDATPFHSGCIQTIGFFNDSVDSEIRFSDGTVSYKRDVIKTYRLNPTSIGFQDREFVANLEYSGYTVACYPHPLMLYRTSTDAEWNQKVAPFIASGAAAEMPQ